MRFDYKIGDKVICWDNEGVESRLTLGKTYTIKNIGTVCVELLEIADGYYMSRFRPAEKIRKNSPGEWI